jgi:PTS system nitrogen regulatory IIA component
MIDKINKDSIVLELTANTKEGVLSELVAAIHNQCPAIDRETLNRIISDREKIGSTGIGGGVAIPHGKLKDLDRVLLAFGRHKKGIGFDAIDNRPVHIFIMILAPEIMAGKYLTTLAEVSRLLKKTATYVDFMQAKNREDVLAVFRSASK